MKRYSCGWCSNTDKKGGYVTVKGYSSTIQHKHAICKDHSKKLHFVIAYCLMNLKEVYPILKELQEKHDNETVETKEGKD